MVRRDVVAVVGPWLAGVSALAAALRARVPGRAFVEAADLAPDHAPVAVVFAVSAVAPLTESDAALLDTAARNTDLLIGAVTKIDVHRAWHQVLATDREMLAARSPRYAQMPWVGVAARRRTASLRSTSWSRCWPRSWQTTPWIAEMNCVRGKLI